MKSSRLMAAVALAAGMAGVAQGDPAETVLSEQSYNVDLVASADRLHCTFTPGRAGTYVPNDTAWVDLKLPADDVPVFKHDEAGVTVQDQLRNGRAVKGDARDTCDRVGRIITDGQAHGGKLTAKKDVVLSIVRYPSGYAGTCQRYLLERVTVHLPLGVDVVSEQSRSLSPLPARDCR